MKLRISIISNIDFLIEEKQKILDCVSLKLTFFGEKEITRVRKFLLNFISKYTYISGSFEILIFFKDIKLS